MNLNVVEMEKRFHSGFTLVEVLVSAVLSTGLLLGLGVAISVSMQGYSTATTRTGALTEARTVTRLLRDDLATMLGTSDEQFFWSGDDERNHEIAFLTLKPIRSQAESEAVSDVCMVHYFTAITRDSPREDPIFSRKLYRRFLSSGEVVGALRRGELPDLSNDPDEAEAIAFNVARFNVQPLQGGEGSGALFEWVPGNGEPNALSVRLDFIAEDAARTLRTEQDWEFETQVAHGLLGIDVDGITRKHTHQYDLELELGQ